MINKQRSTTLACSLLLMGQIAGAFSAAHASDLSLDGTTDTSLVDATGGGAEDMGSKNVIDSKEVTDEGHFGRQRFTLTFDARAGYDSNTLGQPDEAQVFVGFNPTTGKAVYRNVSVGTSDSAFLNFDLGFGYTAANPRLSLTVGADVGVNYFFDRPGRSYDVNGGLSARVTYKASPRLLLEASSYNAYESQGDFGATNLTNFTGVANGTTSTPGTSAQRNGDYFFTTDYLAATYQFAPRLSVVLSNTFVAFAFDDQPYITDEDRIEEYVQTELRYQVKPSLSLDIDYRFGYIDYFSVNNDSYTNFALAGFDYNFSPRLHGGLRAGAEFRTYFDTVGNETSPYFEGNITYDINRNAHLTYNAHYGIEEGDLSADNSKADTFRNGIDYEQNFTPRLSAYLGFYYTHAQYETPVAGDAVTLVYNANGFSEDTFDVAVGGRYAINRHFSAEIGYTYTNVLSEVEVRQYDRHRVFAGVRFAY